METTRIISYFLNELSTCTNLECNIKDGMMSRGGERRFSPLTAPSRGLQVAERGGTKSLVLPWNQMWEAGGCEVFQLDGWAWQCQSPYPRVFEPSPCQSGLSFTSGITTVLQACSQLVSMSLAYAGWSISKFTPTPWQFWKSPPGVPERVWGDDFS